MEYASKGVANANVAPGWGNVTITPSTTTGA